MLCGRFGCRGVSGCRGVLKHITPLSLGEGIGGEAVVVVRLQSYYTIAPFPNPGLLLRLKSVNSGA